VVVTIQSRVMIHLPTHELILVMGEALEVAAEVKAA